MSLTTTHISWLLKSSVKSNDITSVVRYFNQLLQMMQHTDEAIINSSVSEAILYALNYIIKSGYQLRLQNLNQNHL